MLSTMVDKSTIIHTVGTAMYKYAMKYRFYLSFFFGIVPDEETTVMAISMSCNVLYCLLIIWGFGRLPRSVKNMEHALPLS